MKLSEITIEEYIGCYLADVKPDWWGDVSEELIKIIEPFDYASGLNIHKDLLRVYITRAMNIVEGKSNTANEIKEKRLLMSLERRANNNNPYTDHDFSSWIVSVGKWSGYHISRATTLMLDFAMMTKRMNDEYRAQLQALKTRKK
jgi:hypothetical protein